MGRIGRSFQLVAESYRVLMQDKELMVLPLISGVVMVVAVAGFAVPIGIGGAIQTGHGAVAILFLPVYVVLYAIGIFFQAALVAGATERMKGGDPTVRSALHAAWRRIGPILIWAVIAATVGMVIRAIHDRVGFVGRIVAAIAGAAWSFATFFVVPVLVLEDRPVGESFSRSVSVFKQTWGETVVGQVSLGAAAVCAWLTLVAVTGLLAWAVGLAALPVFVVGAIVLMIFFPALQGVYVASLYRYATEGAAPAGFNQALLDQAFAPKAR
ncbi:MAG TPA: DUF6159 family protein [Vicinamibacterales bacterium]|nr:DUF6159 family protein [Vicinamibacterales bacterium]